MEKQMQMRGDREPGAGGETEPGLRVTTGAGGPTAQARRAMAAGWTGRLVDWLRREHGARPRLALLEKISLAPKQSLSLVEADGRRFLVASSAEGTPAFYPLGSGSTVKRTARTARVSW